MKTGPEGGKVIVWPGRIIRVDKPRLVEEQTNKSRYETSGTAYQAVTHV
jgi:hypothetical protein